MESGNLRDALEREPATAADQRSDWTLISVFGVLLCLPILFQVLDPGSDGAAENRVLAPLPAVRSLKELKYLPRMSEAYVNDRFGFRQQLVHVNSLWRYRMGLSSSKDVVLGNDGWLFYTANRLMEQHTGADIFTPAELENWVQRMEAARDWLARRNISFYILIAPDKNVIYPDKLPLYPKRAAGTTRLDQLSERLRKSTLEFIDPRDALMKARAAGMPVYTEGDTHWTEHGALVAYMLLMERVHKRFPNVQSLSFEDYRMGQGRPMATDLTRLLVLEEDLNYSIERLALRKPKPQLGPPVTSMRQGWGWRVVETKTDLPGMPRLLVFGDSFSDYVLGPNMLYETFREPVWTHHNGGTFNLKLVDEVKPDLVVFQIASRYLHLVPLKPIGFD